MLKTNPRRLARTIVGLIAKARCAEREEFIEGIDGDFSVTIAKDLLAMAKAFGSAA
jgi:hypothetical protein